MAYDSWLLWFLGQSFLRPSHLLPFHIPFLPPVSQPDDPERTEELPFCGKHGPSSAQREQLWDMTG